ncbi:clavaminate synthase-like protein At3g21360 [Selaginella moellendorffii]|uniref:clavaminate synthase-like protein At3g21360 n=1 Tax=Selaginella moellendorffii TaxID=88036 RepID=UPI000D1C614D|nr:clavaminate synthase-like protein At3g21360 [Selaginella moellendorffii]|eukprot:XP_024526324.1 clavaminate synthase-like protein At3g21360 [Selaginella moellendorffii]
MADLLAAVAEFVTDPPHSNPPFPQVLVPGSDHPSLEALAAAIRKNKPGLESLLDSSGAILFRGFPVKNAEDFATVVEAFGYKSMGYEAGAAARTYIVGPVFTANELPLEIRIGFHNEMAYLPDYPDVVMFFCEIAPPEGGETGIVQGRTVYDGMAREYPEFVRNLEEKGLVYYNFLAEDEWKEKFGTDDRSQAELKASKLSKKLQWLDDGRVKVYHGPRPAIKQLKENSKTWFNNIGSSDPTIPNLRHLEYGDGTPLPPDALKASLAFMNDHQVPHKWKPGDVMVVNNHAVLHSRHPSKPPRRLLVSMLKTS